MSRMSNEFALQMDMVCANQRFQKQCKRSLEIDGTLSAISIFLLPWFQRQNFYFSSWKYIWFLNNLVGFDPVKLKPSWLSKNWSTWTRTRPIPTLGSRAPCTRGTPSYGSPTRSTKVGPRISSLCTTPWLRTRSGQRSELLPGKDSSLVSGTF